MAPYCLWHTRDGQGNKWRPFYLGQVLLIQINVVFGRRSFLTGKESGSGRLFFCSRVPTTRLRSCETSLEWLAAVDRRSRWCFGVTSSVIGWWLTWEISFSLSLSLSLSLFFLWPHQSSKILPRPDWIDKLPGNQGRKEDRDLSLGSNPKLELALSSLFSTPFCRMDCWLAISSKRGLCRATQPLYRTEENNFFLSLFFFLLSLIFPVSSSVNEQSLIDFHHTKREKLEDFLSLWCLVFTLAITTRWMSQDKRRFRRVSVGMKKKKRFVFCATRTQYVFECLFGHWSPSGLRHRIIIFVFFSHFKWRRRN